MIDIDDRLWPLVTYRFAGEVTLPELESYLERQEAILSRGELTGSVVVVEGPRMWDPQVVRRQERWIEQNRAAVRRAIVGTAFVLSSPLFRGALRAMLVLHPMPQPHKVCSTMDEAFAWVRSRLQEAGVRAPVSSRR